MTQNNENPKNALAFSTLNTLLQTVNMSNVLDTLTQAHTLLLQEATPTKVKKQHNSNIEEVITLVAHCSHYQMYNPLKA